MKKSAIIVAGGMGTRMNSGIPKQFLLLNGKPMLMYSMEAFFLADPSVSIILALPAGEFTSWQKLCDQHAFRLPHQLIEGGLTRFHSVKNSLAVTDDDGLVAIHDGARPLVPESLIRSAFFTAALLGNAVPVIPATDSLRLLSGNTNHAVTRADYCVVQTPQVFYASTIKKAYEQEFREEFTDDATVAESIGETIHLIDGDPLNLKVTHPADLASAEVILASKDNTY